MKGYRIGDVTKDPYMSPLLASDEMLSGLPPVHIVVSILIHPWELTVKCAGMYAGCSSGLSFR